MNDSGSQLDYRLGWRWLLPSIKPGSPCVVVADKASSDFILETFALRRKTSENEKSLLAVIDANFALSDPTNLNVHAIINSDTIAVYGKNTTVERLAKQLKLDQLDLRDYGLIPPKSPRIVVPLGSRISTLSGLLLHRPGRSLAKLAVMILKALLKCGFVWPLKRSRLLIATRRATSPALLSDAEITDFKGDDFALYLGVAGPVRKTIALPVGKSPSKWIIKSAELSSACKKLTNEARMLGELASTLLADRVPSVHSFHQKLDTAILVQQYFKTNAGNNDYRETAVRNFLIDAASVHPSRIPIERFIADHFSLPTQGTNFPENRSARTARLLNLCTNKFCGTLIPIGCTHGDFAPWNCILEKKELRVFDWEEGRMDGIPISDAFSYLVMHRLLLRQDRSSTNMARDAISFAKSVYTSCNIDEKQVDASFVLWCLSRVNYHLGDIYLEMAEFLLIGRK